MDPSDSCRLRPSEANRRIWKGVRSTVGALARSKRKSSLVRRSLPLGWAETVGGIQARMKRHSAHAAVVRKRCSDWLRFRWYLWLFREDTEATILSGEYISLTSKQCAAQCVQSFAIWPFITSADASSEGEAAHVVPESGPLIAQ